MVTFLRSTINLDCPVQSSYVIMTQLTRLLLLTSVVTTVVYSSVDLSLEFIPDQPEAGLTKELTISCTANINNTDNDGMIFLTSMMITYGQPGNETILASVSAMDDKGWKDLSISTGYFNYDPIDETSITITIDDLNNNDTGLYECNAVGLNEMSGHEEIRLNETLSYHQPDNTTYLKEIVSIEDRLKDLESKIDNITRSQRWQHVDENPEFSKIDNGSDRRYLLSKSELGHANMAQFVCFMQGGYLAEVNDYDEYEFLINELRTEMNGTNDGIFVWLGTTDAEKEGTWLHRYHRNDSVYINWSPDSGYSGYDCLAMTSRNNFCYEDYDCGEKGFVLCEL